MIYVNQIATVFLVSKNCASF